MDILKIRNLTKAYANGFQALKSVNLDVKEGEILALLGPNGAGKTTLISAICGLTNITDGEVLVGGHNVQTEPLKTRRLISLVPQEITIEPFEKVIGTVRFSRGLFGLAPDDEYIKELLKRLTLWEKRDNRNMTLSGGMKRRVLIAKALSHKPKLLFLDEPTAGVDVELRNDMWQIVNELKKQGVTIILTTHYIEEAEEVADRIAIINHGEISLVEEKQALMSRLGRKDLTLELQNPLEAIPDSLAHFDLTLSDDKQSLRYVYDTKSDRIGVTSLLTALNDAGIPLKDLHTHTSSLEEIFVSLVKEDEAL